VIVGAKTKDVVEDILNYNTSQFTENYFQEPINEVNRVTDCKNFSRDTVNFLRKDRLRLLKETLGFKLHEMIEALQALEAHTVITELT